jgi:hypothetical protein
VEVTATAQATDAVMHTSGLVLLELLFAMPLCALFSLLNPVDLT